MKDKGFIKTQNANNDELLTGTSDSSIFIMATVVICDVCTVCKVRFTSITLDIVHHN